MTSGRGISRVGRPGDLWTRRPSMMGRALNQAMTLVLRPGADILPANYVGALAVRAGFGAACWVVSWDRTLPHTTVKERGPRGHVRGEWVGKSPRPGDPLIYYLHGSGYIGCSPATHRNLVSELSRRLDRPAFTLAYRRAPEYRFPAAQDDALNGFLWLLEQGHDPADIVVAGDSAGGHLALGLCGQLRELGIGQPRAVVGFSALVDPTWALSAERELTVRDSFMTVNGARRLVGMYTASAALDDPRFAVINAIGPYLPPILLQAGGREVLSADAEAYGAAVRAAGGNCEVEIWPGMFHVFQIAYQMLPEAKAALDHVERFVVAADASVTATSQIANA